MDREREMGKREWEGGDGEKARERESGKGEIERKQEKESGEVREISMKRSEREGDRQRGKDRDR